MPLPASKATRRRVRSSAYKGVEVYVHVFFASTSPLKHSRKYETKSAGASAETTGTKYAGPVVVLQGRISSLTSSSGVADGIRRRCVDLLAGEEAVLKSCQLLTGRLESNLSGRAVVIWCGPACEWPDVVA